MPGKVATAVATAAAAVLLAVGANATPALRDAHQHPRSSLSRDDVQAPLAAPPNDVFPSAPASNWTYNPPALNSTGGSCTFASYKQCDSRWKDEQLGTSSNTICSAGCAMSSLAMYLSSRGHAMSPHDLNQWLKGHGGYESGDLLVWGSVDSLGISYQGQEHDVSVATLTAGLEACHGIIANVRSGSHWVLLTEHVSGDTFRVHDPGFDQDTYTTGEMGALSVYHLSLIHI